MESKIIKFLSLLVFIINTVFGAAISEPLSTSSEFTLNDLKFFKKPIINCKTNDECPSGSTCKNNACLYGTYLCLDVNDKKCQSVNTSIYDPINEKLITEYESSYSLSNPILKTCQEGLNGECKTESCKSNDECFSGTCQSNTCFINNNSIVYLCEGKNTKDTMEFICGHQENMKCSNNDDCFNQKCSNGFCKKDESTPSKSTTSTPSTSTSSPSPTQSSDDKSSSFTFSDVFKFALYFIAALILIELGLYCFCGATAICCGCCSALLDTD